MNREPETFDGASVDAVKNSTTPESNLLSALTVFFFLTPLSFSLSFLVDKSAERLTVFDTRFPLFQGYYSKGGYRLQQPGSPFVSFFFFSSRDNADNEQREVTAGGGVRFLAAQ